MEPTPPTAKLGHEDCELAQDPLDEGDGELERGLRLRKFSCTGPPSWAFKAHKQNSVIRGELVASFVLSAGDAPYSQSFVFSTGDC